MKNTKVHQIANYNQMVMFCGSLGSAYNPGNNSLKIDAMESLLAQVQEKISLADRANHDYRSALNARKELLRQIPSLGSRIMSSLIAHGAACNTVESAMVIKRRLISSGRRKTTELQGENVREGGRISQLDIASRIANFEKLVMLIAAQQKYAPNETELQVDSLKSFIAELRERNTIVIYRYAARKKANIELNDMLYGEESIYEKVRIIKAYIVSKFGHRSPQHRAVTRLKFRNC
jgi:hypothetical protein